MTTTEIRVDPPKDESFESCLDCIHADDNIDICKLRLCIHAIDHLRECYKPKKGVNHEQKRDDSLPE